MRWTLVQCCYRWYYYWRILGNNPKDASDGQETWSGVADASGIVATSAAESGDPTAIVLVVWDSEDRRERGELEMAKQHP